MLSLGIKPKSPACVASTLLIKASPSHSATIFDDQADLNRSSGKFKRLPVSQVRCSESKTMAGLCFFWPSIPTWKTELNPCANYLRETPNEFYHSSIGAIESRIHSLGTREEGRALVLPENCHRKTEQHHGQQWWFWAACQVQISPLPFAP